MILKQSQIKDPRGRPRYPDTKGIIDSLSILKTGEGIKLPINGVSAKTFAKRMRARIAAWRINGLRGTYAVLIQPDKRFIAVQKKDAK